MSERRAPVQGDSVHELGFSHPARVSWESREGRVARPAGTISWDEHLRAWDGYASRFGGDQSAERLAERGGFSYGELVMFLGHEPETWEPRQSTRGGEWPMGSNPELDELDLGRKF